MASYVDVANNAASSIGEDDQLTAPDDDTHLGRSIAAVWDMARRAALRRHRWNFATATVNLAQLDASPAAGFYSAAYQLPADNLRLLQVQGIATSDYAVQGRAILANLTGALTIVYLRDMPEPATWDDLFAEAFAHFLGFKVADRITGDRARKNDAWASYKEAVADAMRCNAIENPPIQQGSVPWEEARFGVDDWGGGDGWYPGIGTRTVWVD